MSSISANSASISKPSSQTSAVVHWIAFAALLSAPFILQRPFFSIVNYSDELNHWSAIAQYASDRISTDEYLFRRHNEHWLPLWRVWLYLQWRMGGLDPLSWHLVLTGVHAASAVVTYLLLQRTLEAFFPAFVGAMLWSTATIGSWDNPQSWVPASHLSMGYFWILAAMVCIAGLSEPYWKLRLAFFGLFASAGIATMGAMVVCAALLPVQFLLLESACIDRRRSIGFWTVWLASVVGVGGAQFLNSAPSSEMELNYPAVARGLGIAVGEFVVSLQRLFPWPVSLLRDSATIPLAWVAFFVLACLALTMRGRPGKLVATVACIVFVYTFVACWARNQIHFQVLMDWGRYRYLPTHVWCVAAGCAAAHLDLRFPRARRSFFFGWIVILALSVVQQARQSENSDLEFNGEYDRPRQHFMRMNHALREASNHAAKSGDVVALPDEVIVPYSKITMSEYALVRFPEGLAGLKFLPVESYSSADRRRAVEKLRDCPDEWVRKIADVLSQPREDAQTAPGR